MSQNKRAYSVDFPGYSTWSLFWHGILCGWFLGTILILTLQKAEKGTAHEKKQQKGIALTTFLGLGGGIFCVALAIAEGGHGNVGLFINIPSLLIIVGGTACVLIMSFPFSVLKTLGSVLMQAFVLDRHEPLDDIETLVELCEVSRRKGLLALESYAMETTDPFLKRGLNLLIDGCDLEEVESALQREISHSQRRHGDGVAMVSMIASTAPGLGLVGTYVGLIPMLVNMMDPDKLGPMMAIELVSSFYGGFLANVVFSPLAKRLQRNSAMEKARNMLLMDGLLGIRNSKNPRLLREELMSHVTKKQAMKGEEKRKSKANAGDNSANSSGKVIDYKARTARRKEA